jgi:hypothetical protein
MLGADAAGSSKLFSLSSLFRIIKSSTLCKHFVKEYKQRTSILRELHSREGKKGKKERSPSNQEMVLRRSESKREIGKEFHGSLARGCNRVSLTAIHCTAYASHLLALEKIDNTHVLKSEMQHCNFSLNILKLTCHVRPDFLIGDMC